MFKGDYSFLVVVKILNRKYCENIMYEVEL